MPRVFLPRLLFLLCLPLLLAACGSTDVSGRRAVTSTYCDNFLIYDMCARDTNRDGVVDFVYFTDSDEIFMYSAGAEQRFPPDRPVHRCAVEMDEDLVAVTSKLFFLDDDSTYLEKQDIRGGMMVKYIAYMPDVTACNMQADEVADNLH